MEPTVSQHSHQPASGQVDDNNLPAVASLATLFQMQAQRRRDHCAVTSSEGDLTYSQLNAVANDLADNILQFNVPKDLPVVIRLNQSLELVIAIIACLKAGHFFTPIDPADPLERSQAILTNSQARLILTSEFIESNSPLKNSQAAVLKFALADCEKNTLQSTNAVLPSSTVLPDQPLACVLYTSGSTGVPKGVVQSQRSILHNVKLHQASFQINDNDVQSLLYGSSVYGGIRDIFNALLSGITLAMYPLRQLGFAGLKQWLIAQNITLYCSVASVFRELVKQPNTFPFAASIPLVKLGGEATFARDVALFKAVGFTENCILHCGLGSTETGLVCEFPITHATEITFQQVPLGDPVADKKVFIVDEYGAFLPENCVGEIIIRSHYIAQGYWRNPELTNAAFQRDELGVSSFRSGDLGKFDASGCLIYCGRKDSQVKVRGYRVEIGEVEAALMNCSQITEAAVIAKTGNDSTQLIAYVVFDASSALSVAQFKSEINQRLPAYMVPSHFQALSSLPKTANGKVNRLALPDPDFSVNVFASNYEPPRNHLELVLLDIWKSALQAEKLGITDCFFDHGGDSLKGADVINQIEQKTGTKITLSQLASLPTVRQLSDALHKLSKDQSFLLAGFDHSADAVALYCLYGVMVYKPLADCLAACANTYGIYLEEEFDVLKSQNSKAVVALPTLERIAAHYIAKITTLNPKGPFVLCGLSFGGVVAFEVARQLLAKGFDVPRVILLDSATPEAFKPAGVRGHLSQLKTRFKNKLWVMKFNLVGRGLLPNSLLGNGEHQTAVNRTQLRKYIKHDAYRKHSLSAIDCDVILIKAQEQIDRPGFRTLANNGWRPYVNGNYSEYSVPGNHLTIMDPPNVAQMAEIIARQLHK